MRNGVLLSHPASVLGPESALGLLPSIALSSAQAECICTVLADAGVPISVVPPKGKKRCATAGELSNKRWNPKDWRQLKIGESPQAGDVAAYPLTPAPGDRDIYSGHSGIVTGEGVIASHENGVYVQPGQFDSTIEGIVYRRYIGD